MTKYSKYNEATQKALSELMALVYKLNRPDFTLFLNFSGHVDKISGEYHPGGWCSGDIGLGFHSILKAENIYNVMAELEAAFEDVKKSKEKAIALQEQRDREELERLKAKLRKRKAKQIITP